jgi:hypothetical protein
LRDAQPRSGPSEMQLVVHREEVPEVSQPDRRMRGSFS